jgi:hypothetical protein
MLGECQALLHDFKVQEQEADVWRWRFDPESGYTVSGAYQLLTTQEAVPLDDAADLIWHRQVPLKVSILA